MEDIKSEAQRLIVDIIAKVDEISRYVKSLKKVSVEDSNISVRTTETEDLEIDLRLKLLFKRK